MQSHILGWSSSDPAWFRGIVCIDAPKDGSCLFHAVVAAFHKPYRSGQVNRGVLIRSLRRDLSLRLMDHNGDRLIYNTLSGGTLEDQSKSLDRLKISNMISELDSNNWVDNLYNELLSNELDKDIFIVDRDSRDIVIMGNDHLLYKERPSIVLLYSHRMCHYDLIGIHDSDTGMIDTYFDPRHDYIQKIKLRIKEKTKMKN